MYKSVKQTIEFFRKVTSHQRAVEHNSSIGLHDTGDACLTLTLAKADLSVPLILPKAEKPKADFSAWVRFVKLVPYFHSNCVLDILSSPKLICFIDLMRNFKKWNVCDSCHFNYNSVIRTCLNFLKCLNFLPESSCVLRKCMPVWGLNHIHRQGFLAKFSYHSQIRPYSIPLAVSTKLDHGC